MKCADITLRLVDYLYGELSSADRSAFDAHVAGCESCGREVGSMERTLGQARTATRGVLAQTPPAQVRAVVLAAASAAQKDIAERGSFWRWLSKPWLLPVFAAASAITVFVIAKSVILNPEPLMKAKAPEEAALLLPKDREVRQQAPAQSKPLTEAPMESAPAADEGSALRRVRGKAKQNSVARAAAEGRADQSRWAQPPAGWGRAADDVNERADRDERGEREADSVAERSLSFAAAPASPPPAPAPATTADSKAEAQSKGRNQPEAPLSLVDLMRKAERYYDERRWGEAVAVYRELLRRFPQHKSIAVWKARLATAEHNAYRR